jgi:hypothetical protein
MTYEPKCADFSAKLITTAELGLGTDPNWLTCQNKKSAPRSERRRGFEERKRGKGLRDDAQVLAKGGILLACASQFTDLEQVSP